MDRKLQLETLALVLLLVAFPVISLGSSHGNTPVWVIGVVMVVLGGLIPVGTRFMKHGDDKARDAGIEYDDRAS